MRLPPILSMLIIATFAMTFCLSEAMAGAPRPPALPGAPKVNVHIDGYLPAPPGVHVHRDNDRPYYVEKEQRIYLVKEVPGNHGKKKKKHHGNNGRNQHNRYDD